MEAIQVSVENLSFAYGPGKGVLRGCTFEIPGGVRFGIFGENGSGKTTLLKLLAGLLEAKRGVVTFRQGRTQMGRVRMGMAFQRGGLFEALTVVENLELVLREQVGYRRETIDHEMRGLLEALGIAHAANLPAGQLSGGMVKRLSLARALLLEPQLLLLDEPTAGLDPVTSQEIEQVLVQLQEARGITCAVVSSDPILLERFCTHQVELCQGRVVARRAAAP